MKVATNQERLNELFDKDSRNDTAIAESLGVSKQAISAWRSGRRSPKKTMLVKISEKYNVSLEWLMGFDVEKEGHIQLPTFFSDSQKMVKFMQAMPFEDYKTFVDILRRAEQKLKEKGEL